MGVAEDFKRVGIVGAGTMGTMIAFGLSEHGVDVSLWDVKPENVNDAMKMAKVTKSLKGKVDGFHDIGEFTKSLNVAPRKVFIFSITHGNAADSVLESIEKDLMEGDIVLDGGNEHYRNTERRQKKLSCKGVNWIGMGVSGGYQSARRGPSMSPGGNKEAIETVLPLLREFAAKDEKSGQPCVEYIGPAGSGHYVKMVHNGIENGLLSTVCEAWGLLRKSFELSNDQIGKIFEAWNIKGELKNTYLVQIGSEICQRRKSAQGDKNGEGKGSEDQHVLDDVLDKVVQDDDSSEGTLFWSVSEAALRHVSAPTIAAGHFFRVASGDRDQRLRVAEKLKIPSPRKFSSACDVEKFVETLRQAVYCSILAAYCQGLELVARASTDEGWDVDLGTCIKIWRAGCIIQEEHIADLLEPIFKEAKEPIMNVKLIDEVASDLSKGFPALKDIVLMATEVDDCIPSLSASLEYLKYCGGTMLPTQFMAAEMDFFGAHAYDRPNVAGEDPGKAETGAHHYEWRPA
jgi:6-phosphogluconate dehydrogenase